MTTHADIVAAIEKHGGRLVASFELDEDGPICGEKGHTSRASEASA